MSSWMTKRTSPSREVKCRQTARFYTEPGGDVTNNVRYRAEVKFPRKLLVWMAISPRGVSKPVILPSRVNVGGEIYQEKCLKEGLLPFLSAKYPHEGFIFWPDLAAAHYARETLQFLQDAGVPVVGRDDNPPNVPQLRPIEDYWGLLKQEVYKGGWEATSEDQLKRRIRRAVEIISPEVPLTMMRRVGERVRAANRQGVAQLLH